MKNFIYRLHFHSSWEPFDPLSKVTLSVRKNDPQFSFYWQHRKENPYPVNVYFKTIRAAFESLKVMVEVEAEEYKQSNPQISTVDTYIHYKTVCRSLQLPSKRNFVKDFKFDEKTISTGDTVCRYTLYIHCEIAVGLFLKKAITKDDIYNSTKVDLESTSIS